MEMLEPLLYQIRKSKKNNAGNLLKFGLASFCLFMYFPFATKSVVLAQTERLPKTEIYIDLGNDSGIWARNNVCDDPRFEGPGVDDILAGGDSGHDASDCRIAIDAGLARLRKEYIAFGDDSGDWVKDGQCDDPRFFNENDSQIILSEDILTDATDCQRQYTAKEIDVRLTFEP